MKSNSVVDLHSKYNCCWVLGLQTGVQLIVFTDYFTLIFLMILSLTSYIVEDSKVDYISYAFVLFILITDGIIMLLYFVKIWFGTRFLRTIWCPSRRKRKEQVIIPNQDANQ